MTDQTTPKPEHISGPHSPCPTVRICDIGGERLPTDFAWWMVLSTDRHWAGDVGAACATHAGQKPLAVKTRNARPVDGYARATEPLMSQSALHHWTEVTVDPRLIGHALADEPELTRIADVHGWDDAEVMDKLWSILCVTLRGITYSEQTARHLGDRYALADDMTAAHHRWVIANPTAA